MTEEKKDSKKCGGKKKIMFAYGFIQLGSSFVSAVALAAIAFGFCSVKKESKIFNIRSFFMYYESFLKVSPTQCLPKECFILTT